MKEKNFFKEEDIELGLKNSKHADWIPATGENVFFCFSGMQFPNI